MVAVRSHRLTAKQQAEKLLHERDTIADFVAILERLQVAIQNQEERYGIPSEDLSEAIENGRIEETEDVCDWLIDFELLQRAKVVAS